MYFEGKLDDFVDKFEDEKLNDIGVAELLQQRDLADRGARHTWGDRLKDVQRRIKRNHRSSLGKRPSLDRSMMWVMHRRRRPRKE